MRLGVTALAVEALAIAGDAAAGLNDVTPFRASDRGFISRPGDSVANENFPARVAVPLVVERMVPMVPETPRRVGVAAGEIVLHNPDGFYDAHLRDFAIDGRRVVVKVGRPDFAYDGFMVLWDGTASGWRLADDASLRIALRDIGWRLDVPVQGTLYAGTGGLNGGDDLKGKPQPLLFGKCLNVTATLVDPANLIFQLVGGSVQSIGAVYDQGLGLTFAGDVADITATTVLPGQYKTQLSGGYFRLGALPAGLVTADCEGDNAGGYVATTAGIFDRLIRTRGGLVTAEIDTASLAALAAAQGATVGIYIGPAQRSLPDVLDELMAGIAGWWGASRLGQIQVGRVAAPDLAQSVARLTTVEIIDLQRLEPPASVNPPNWRRRVEYQRNWTVQETDLAATVTAARRGFLAEHARIAPPAVDSSIQITYRQATDPPPLPGLFAASADAGAEAARLLALYGVPRMAFAVLVKLVGFRREIGETVEIVYPRHGLDNGAAAYVLGHRLDADRNEAVLTVFV